MSAAMTPTQVQEFVNAVQDKQKQRAAELPTTTLRTRESVECAAASRDLMEFAQIAKMGGDMGKYEVLLIATTAILGAIMERLDIIGMGLTVDQANDLLNALGVDIIEDDEASAA